MTNLEALVQLRNDIKTWVINNLGNKVDKITGKGLSTNDYTTQEKRQVKRLNNQLTDSRLILEDEYGIEYYITVDNATGQLVITKNM